SSRRSLISRNSRSRSAIAISRDAECPEAATAAANRPSSASSWTTNSKSPTATSQAERIRLALAPCPVWIDRTRHCETVDTDHPRRLGWGRLLGRWTSLRRGTDDLASESVSDRLLFPNHSRSSRPPIGESRVPVNLTYFVLMPAKALTTA